MIPLGVLGASGVAPAPTSVQYLVIGGGGGGALAGANLGAGGGGAGGYRCSVPGELSGRNSPAETPLTVAEATSYTVTVGAGGAGGQPGTFTASRGSNSVFGSITAQGGGRGASGLDEVGGNGGSGGGGGHWYDRVSLAAPSGGAGTADQGFAGGIGSGGGGGGAGRLGFTPSGGTGIASSITGTSVVRAVGGNGMPDSPGFGGGGAAGTANRGNGGQAFQGNQNINQGGAGGSGVVIIRYPDSFRELRQIGAGLTYTYQKAGGFNIYSFTAGTGAVNW